MKPIACYAKDGSCSHLIAPKTPYQVSLVVSLNLVNTITVASIVPHHITSHETPHPIVQPNSLLHISARSAVAMCLEDVAAPWFSMARRCR
jgi:hypothetical protein